MEQAERTPGENYTPPDYIIETVTDEAGILAAAPVMVGPLRCRRNLVLGLLLFLLAPSLFFIGEALLAVCMLIVGVCSLILYTGFPNRVAQKQVARFRESYGTDAVPCQLVFWPQGVVVTNRCSGGSAQMRYEIVRQLHRRGDYLVLRTEEKQSVIIRMADLAPFPDFIPYLKEKCPGAKVKNL